MAARTVTFSGDVLIPQTTDTATAMDASSGGYRPTAQVELDLGPAQLLDASHFSVVNTDFALPRLIYKMRGWYSIGNDFEYWSTSDYTAPPPSGNTLTNIAIAAIIDGEEED